MYKLGLKIWSSNTSFIDPAFTLYKKKIFNYIELYAVPGSFNKYSNFWIRKKFSYFLHAPHSYSGFNLSIKRNRKKNAQLLQEIDSYRRALNPKQIIFHPGIQGSMIETIRQIKLFKKEFPVIFGLAAIENNPRLGIKGEACIGSTPEDIKRLLSETGLSFCLDIGHAICSSVSTGIYWESIIDCFLKLYPHIYHLSDGDRNSPSDSHLNFGEGNFDLYRIIKKIPAGSYVSIETNKKPGLKLKDFERDVKYFHECQNS